MIWNEIQRIKTEVIKNEHKEFLNRLVYYEKSQGFKTSSHYLMYHCSSGKFLSSGTHQRN